MSFMDFVVSRPKWHQIYNNSDEMKLFKALAGHKDYDWRSVDALVKETGLTEKRVEEIIKKYSSQKYQMIIKNPKNEKWGYWERVKDELKDYQSIADKDQENRIKKAKKDDDAPQGSQTAQATSP